MGDESKRPDRWGIIIDIWEIPGESKHLVNLWECIPGRFNATDIQALISALLETRKYVIAGRPINREQHLFFPDDMMEEAKRLFVESAVKELYARQEKTEAAG